MYFANYYQSGRHFFVLLVALFLCAYQVVYAAERVDVLPGVAASTNMSLTADQAKLDTRILKRALSELHPALTKYRSQAEVDAIFARFEARATAAREVNEMYLAATELAAAIGCGHTWTNVLNQQGAIKAVLLDAANKLPLTMALIENRWLVLASADARVRAGDEIMAVNSIVATDMVARLMPYLRADGSSDGKRLKQLSHDRLDYSQMDIVWPLLSPPVAGQYRLDIRRNNGATQTVVVDATTLALREKNLAAQGMKSIDKTWKFRIENNVGYLTLPSFSFWSDNFDWRKFIEESFAELDKKRVPNLVIDIRDNEGGDGAIGTKIISHLIRAPFQYTSDQSTSAYERVPYSLVKYLDTWDYRFFDRTGMVEKIITGTAAGKYKYLPKAFGERVIAPVATPYAGHAYLLVGAENSSATFAFALFSQQSRAATLVGQRTGGNLRGLNGGELMWVTLPNSGVSVDIPVLAVTYTAATPDSSVIPDIVVKQNYAAKREGRDEEMAAVIAIIQKAKGLPSR